MVLRTLCSAKAGMTFIEIVTVVAVVGVVGSAVFASVQNITSKVEDQKLARDVATINRAIHIYRLSGGSMDGVNPHPWWVLGKLKSEITGNAQEESTGFTGDLIDARLQPVFMTSQERLTDQPRAVWNATEQEFEILYANTGTGVHVRAFELTDDVWIDEVVAEYFTDNPDVRDDRAFDFASGGYWVWDYEDSSAGSGPEPTAVTLYIGTPSSGGVPAGMTQLDPPTFSIASGSYPLTSFALSLSLVNPNSPAVSEIYYSTSLGVWQLYTGAPIAVPAGQAVQAMANSTDPVNWVDSGIADSAYDAIPVELELAVSAPASVNWMEVGGAVMPGGPATAAASPGLILLTNGGDIPDAYENSGNFLVHWTVDGSDPASPGTRYTSGAFAGGFGGEAVSVVLAEWGLQSSLPILAYAESLGHDLFYGSDVMLATVGISAVTLRVPTITNVSDTVTIDLDVTGGDMPTGARIYYTLDGSDPGDSGGDPVGGMEYTVPFAVTGMGAGPVVTITARVYGTDTLEHWFNVSNAAVSNVPKTPAVISFTMSAGDAP